jgi:hypothetical protein
MTADNRTNVQIVADALRSMPEAERDDDRDPAVVVAEYAVAALVAAQGAANQLRDEAWLTEYTRVKQAEAWDACIGEMPIDPDWKNFYGDNNPYRKGEER